MRVLVTTPAGLGHIHPMVPLAQALAHRGHEVRWALPEQAAAHIAAPAIEAIPIAGRDPITPQDVMRRFPALAELAARERPDAMFGKLFGAMATPPMLAGLEPVALDWRPHLVVADAAEFADHIVAARLGVPSVTKGFGALLPEARMASAAEEVAALWTSRGLVPRPYGGAYDYLYIDIYPPELQVDTGEHVRHRQLMRPVTDDGATDESTLPLPRVRRDRPLVYVTMGTVFNDPEPLRLAVEGVRALDVRVLATVGRAADPAYSATNPATWSSNDTCLKRPYYRTATSWCHMADPARSSGRSRSVSPSCAFHRGADQFLNAEAVAASGAGLSISPDAASADAIQDAVAIMLRDEAYRNAALRVAVSIEAMPPPDDVAGVLEQLA